MAGGRLYFAGDTGYSDHFRMIRARLGRMDVALLPIGTFPLTPEPIDEPVEKLQQAIHARRIARAAFRVIEAGESIHARARANGESTTAKAAS